MAMVKAIGVSCFILLAVVSDIKTRKIKNSLNSCFLFFGLVLNTFTNDWSGFVLSLSGIITPLIMLIPLYILGMLGAGDIKLFATVGSIMGCDFVLATITLSFLAGGAICLTLLILNGCGGKCRFKVLITYLKTCLLTYRLHDYREFDIPGNPGWFRFSLAVAPAVAAQLLFKLDISVLHFAGLSV